jgi:hypothetical protein
MSEEAKVRKLLRDGELLRQREPWIWYIFYTNSVMKLAVIAETVASTGDQYCSRTFMQPPRTMMIYEGGDDELVG